MKTKAFALLLIASVCFNMAFTSPILLTTLGGVVGGTVGKVLPFSPSGFVATGNTGSGVGAANPVSASIFNAISTLVETINANGPSAGGIGTGGSGTGGTNNGGTNTGGTGTNGTTTAGMNFTNPLSIFGSLLFLTETVNTNGADGATNIDEQAVLDALTLLANSVDTGTDDGVPTQESILNALASLANADVTDFTTSQGVLNLLATLTGAVPANGTGVGNITVAEQQSILNAIAFMVGAINATRTTVGSPQSILDAQDTLKEAVATNGTGAGITSTANPKGILSLLAILTGAINSTGTAGSTSSVAARQLILNALTVLTGVAISTTGTFGGAFSAATQQRIVDALALAIRENVATEA